MPLARDLVEPGLAQGLAVEEQALVDGLGAEKPVEFAGKCRLRGEAGVGNFGRQAVGGVLGRQQLDKFAFWVLEGLRDGVNAIKALNFVIRPGGLLVIGHARPYIELHCRSILVRPSRADREKSTRDSLSCEVLWFEVRNMRRLAFLRLTGPDVARIKPPLKGPGNTRARWRLAQAQYGDLGECPERQRGRTVNPLASPS